MANRRAAAVVKRWTGCAAIALLLGAGGIDAARATTLQEALLATYQGNPTLTGQRAQLRATDENAAIARSQGRPQINGNAQFTQGLSGLPSVQGYNRALTAGATVSLPIFQGGRVRNAIRAADTRVEGGRADLRAVEGDVFVDAVTAYMDVLRDRAIVRLNANNVKVLETNLQATQDRFQVGDVTRTDVAQSQARLELGRSQLAAAQASLVASEENYRRVIGSEPTDLETPPPLPTLPATPDAAEDTAIASNPAIASAEAAVEAAHYDVSAARGERLPTISLSGGENYFNYLNSVPGGLGIGGPSDHGDYSSVGVTATIPFYQGGGPGARVRQAQANESQAMEQKTAVERQVVANTRAAFSSYDASLDTINSSEVAVKANTLALEGTRAENSVGTRTVLDVLNAEQELLNSQVTLVTARHDAYVAGFALLNAMGLVNYKHLGLVGGTLYDPTIHYRHSIHALSDFDEDPKPRPVAKPTYGPQLPAENPPVTPAAK